MRICIVSPFAYGINISPRLYQATLLAEKGHKVLFLTPHQQYMLRSMRKNRKSLMKDFQYVKMRYFNVAYPFPSLAYPFPNILEETKLICNIIKEEKVDIVHFYQPEFLTSVPLPLIKKKFNIPVLLTVNGFPGISWFYGESVVDFVGLSYTQTAVRFLMRYADKILLYATNLKQYAKRIGVPEEKMVFLPEGIEFNVPYNNNEGRETVRRKLGVSNNEKLITFTGRLVPVKGVNILIEAFKSLHDEYSNCKLLIVGDGPYRKLYEKQSGRLLNRAIIFTGLVKPRKVVKFLLASDIFVLPSLSEGIPSSLLEACLCGLPCVATNTGAIPDIIKKGESGLIIRPNDADALLQALVLLLNDEAMAMEMGKKAAERVKKLFNWNNIVRKYERICEELLKK